MSNDLLLLLDTAVDSAQGSESSKDAGYYIRRAREQNTYNSYKSALKQLSIWSGMSMPLPTTPEFILDYLLYRTKQSKPAAPSTLYHIVSAIRFAHEVLVGEGTENPADNKMIRLFLSGYKKERVDNGWRKKQAPALSLDELTRMIIATSDDLRGMRDKAFILCGTIGCFRENELTGLKVDQIIDLNKENMVFDMGGVKADRLNEKNNTKVLANWSNDLHAVSAVNAWLRESNIDEGYIFRTITRWGVVDDRRDKAGNPLPMSHNSANRIIRSAAKRAGLENCDSYTVHSLRATFISICREYEIPDEKIVLQSNHRDAKNLNIYDRPADFIRMSPAVIMAAYL